METILLFLHTFPPPKIHILLQKYENPSQLVNLSKSAKENFDSQPQLHLLPNHISLQQTRPLRPHSFQLLPKGLSQQANKLKYLKQNKSIFTKQHFKKKKKLF